MHVVVVVVVRPVLAVLHVHHEDLRRRRCWRLHVDDVRLLSVNEHRLRRLHVEVRATHAVVEGRGRRLRGVGDVSGRERECGLRAGVGIHWGPGGRASRSS